MNFVTKLIVSVITISAAIVGSLWGAFEILDARMDHKVDTGKVIVVEMIRSVKDDSDVKLKAAVDEADLKLKIVDTKMFSELTGLKSMVGSIDSKINILMSRLSVDSKKYGEEGSYATYKQAEK